MWRLEDSGEIGSNGRLLRPQCFSYYFIPDAKNGFILLYKEQRKGHLLNYIIFVNKGKYYEGNIMS